MEAELHFDMCDLDTSFKRDWSVSDLAERVKCNIPPHLGYACTNWSPHLAEVPYDPFLIDAVSNFAHKSLLFWFEAMSLMGGFQKNANRALLRAAFWAVSACWLARVDASLRSFRNVIQRYPHF